ncbi:MAG: protein kinase [Gemmataceae bacterium]|nr:protein kinase [Gemmataceae bacterium]
MPVRIEANAEPIAGYRLIERLGGGGFGEVWKAEAPGGLFKAIKFVFGDLQAADSADGARAEQELKALSRVKTVHHPYILSLERYDIIDGQLIIVMELADRTLWDRFKESRQQGLQGIPREELLNYVEETSEALDLMNSQFQLQHLDIKPQNLFLVFNHIKVADFGLVKDLGNMAAATITGGVTPVYAAPETFDGWLSRFSDQYSLAIVYQELLTGQRPFQGSTMRQLVMQHLQGEPNLSLLPPEERPVIARALSKNPDERFPTCVDMVQALRNAGKSGPPAAPPHVAPAVQVDTPTSKDYGDPRPKTAAGDSIALTWNARGGEKPIGAGLGLPARPLGEARPQFPAPSMGNLPTPHDSQPMAAMAQPTDKLLSQLVDKAQSFVAAIPEEDLAGVVQPALVVGLGRLGIETLRRLRQFLNQEFDRSDCVPYIRMVGLDVDADTVQNAGSGDPRTSLRANELMVARLQRPSHYLKGFDGKPMGGNWLNPKLLYRIPKQASSTGVRALSRLAFADHLRMASRRLEMELQACCSNDTLHEMARHTDIGIRTQTPRVYIVAALGGSTGSGMFIDAAYLMRHLLRKQGHPNAEIVGLFYLPPVGREGIRSASLANAYASLVELDHYSRNPQYSLKYETGEGQKLAELRDSVAPFSRCMLMNLPEKPQSLEESTPTTVDEAAQHLGRELATPLGKSLDHARKQWRKQAQLSTPEPYWLQSFGMRRIVWPRQAMLERSARKMCQRLVDRWMAKNAKPIADEVHTWAIEQWDAQEMRPESIIQRLQEQTEAILQQPVDRMIQGVVSPLARILAANENAGAKSPINLGPAVQAMEAIDKMLGVPEEFKTTEHHHQPPAIIEQALADAGAAVADASDQRLASTIVSLIEQPRFRLAGAEEGLRQFIAIIEDALHAQETLARELTEKANGLYERIHRMLEVCGNGSGTGSMWGFSKKTPSSIPNFGSDLYELMRTYPKLRYQSLVLSHVNRLYVGLRGHLSDQIREVGFCRQRLAELLACLKKDDCSSASSASPSEQHILPDKCKSLDDAVKQCETSILDEHLFAFDQTAQEMIRKQFRALLEICMGSASVVRNLTPALLKEAEKYLEPGFQGASVAEIVIAQKGNDDPERLAEFLQQSFDETAPELGRVSPEKEIAAIALAGDASGQALGELAAGTQRGLNVVWTDQADQIVFYRELQQVALRDLEQFGPIAAEAYHQRLTQDPSSVHTREDVADWRPLPASVAPSR